MDAQELSMCSLTALQKSEKGYEPTEGKPFTITSPQIGEEKMITTSLVMPSISNNLTNLVCKVHREEVLSLKVVSDTNLEHLDENITSITDKVEIDNMI